MAGVILAGMGWWLRRQGKGSSQRNVGRWHTRLVLPLLSTSEPRLAPLRPASSFCSPDEALSWDEWVLNTEAHPLRITGAGKGGRGKGNKGARKSRFGFGNFWR